MQKEFRLMDSITLQNLNNKKLYEIILIGTLLKKKYKPVVPKIFINEL